MRVDLGAERAVHGGERRAESDRATREQDVLHGGKQRLRLRLAAPLQTRDEEMHRHLVQVLGEVQRRLHVAPLRVRERRVLRRASAGAM